MALNAITVRGFKSIFDEQRIEVAPVTIFAGANSGGKSSASQPLLLLKQTIESQYDPEAILLYGPNVKFTSSDQVLSRGSGLPQRQDFSLGFHYLEGFSIKVGYELGQSGSIRAKKVEIKTPSGIDIAYSENSEFAMEKISEEIGDHLKPIINHFQSQTGAKLVWSAVPARCFPDLGLGVKVGNLSDRGIPVFETLKYPKNLRQLLKNIIHIRGLRGNPERSYLSTAKTKTGFPGAFEDYVASILMQWQEDHSDALGRLGNDLRLLGLTWKVKALPIQDTHAEIRVGRLESPTQGGANDLVSLADVGLGVSQALPFLVAIRVAKKDQIVFVEQPEIHLHPKAQFRLAELIVGAAKRGVRVWVETHSSILIRGIQTQVAVGNLKNTHVAMNWFQRNSSTGATIVTARTPDELGRLRDWPVDFDDVSMQANREYLDAVAAAKMKKK